MQRLPAVGPVSPTQIVQGFVPTRRFSDVSFESYEPDPAHPSQFEARERLIAFAAALTPPANPLLRLLPMRQLAPKGVYLDGGFGVGKTHLLAATYHATPGKRQYLSFAELAYTIARLGMEPTLKAFADTRLLCIDEFELDDVAQTRMASMFLRRLFDKRGARTHVVTTSNTLPSDLGQGRFAAEAFQREIGEIAAYFEVVTIDGEDYRHRHWNDLDAAELATSAQLSRSFEDTERAGRRAGVLEWPHLASQLELLHPVHYAQVAQQLDALFIRNLDMILDQAVALRLVHLVDKLYDQQVRLAVSTRGGLPLADVFAFSYRHGSYEKKYRRCLSRLHELLAETAAATRPAPPSSAPAAPLAGDRDAHPTGPARAD
jgi:cell division protein ZapE